MPRSDVLKVHQDGLLDRQSLDLDLESFEDVVDGQVERLEKLLNTLRAGVARAKESTELTATGQSRAIQTMGREARLAIDEVGIPEQIELELDKARAALPELVELPREPADPSQRGPFSTETRLKMVLDRLIELDRDRNDPVALQSALRSAATLGDAEPIIAAQRCPRSVLSIDGELIAEVREEFYKLHRSDEWKRRDRLERVQRLLTMNIKQARKQVDSIVGPDFSVPPVPVTA